MDKKAAKQQKNSKSKRTGEHLKEYQFKPGKSGNENGRPKGSVSLIAAIRKDAREKGVGKVVAKIRELAESGDKYFIELWLKLLDADDWKAANALPVGGGAGSGSYEITVRYVSGDDNQADN